MLKTLLARYSPKFVRTLIRTWKVKEYQKSISNKSMQEVFEYIYTNNKWGTKSIPSGKGSSIEQTKKIIDELPLIFNKYDIRSVLDLPCGDFTWMSQVKLGDISYLGGDIVQELVDVNNEKYATSKIKFIHMDIVNDPLPNVDVLLCRDCFVHLTHEQISQSLENIKKSEINYLLVTSFTGRAHNKNILTGEWRPLNMEIAPFNLEALERWQEDCPEDNGAFKDKSLILIDLNDGATRKESTERIT